MKKNLSELTNGESGIILTVRGEQDLKQRLLEMGFTPGTEVNVERYAPFNDPVEYKIRGYHISLRRSEASNIIVAM